MPAVQSAAKMPVAGLQAMAALAVPGALCAGQPRVHVIGVQPETVPRGAPPDTATRGEQDSKHHNGT